VVISDDFRADVSRLAERNPNLRRGLKKKIRVIVENPLTIGKRSKSPANTRHVHVMSRWVIFWKVEGEFVTLLRCGRHDEFFRS